MGGVLEGLFCGIGRSKVEEIAFWFEHSVDLVHQLYETVARMSIYIKDARNMLDKVNRGTIVEHSIWKRNWFNRQVCMADAVVMIGPHINTMHCVCSEYIVRDKPTAKIQANGCLCRGGHIFVCKLL